MSETIVATTLLSLEDAAAHVGKHPQTLLRWHEAGEFAAEEMYQLASTRGRGRAWCVDLEAARRVARLHWTPTPVKPSLFPASTPAGVVYIPQAPRTTAHRASQRASRPMRVVPTVTPRDPDLTVTRKLHPKSGPPLPKGLRSVAEVQASHHMNKSRRYWLTAERRGRLHIKEGAWRNHLGSGHVGYALDEANQRIFGQLFAERITACGVEGCLVCAGRGEASGGEASGGQQRQWPTEWQAAGPGGDAGVGDA